MLIRTPPLNAEQIAIWMRHGAKAIAPASGETFAPVTPAIAQRHAEFDFKKAKRALDRARAKTSVRTIKPLRRLRTNQAAVNESLLDAFGALLAINKSMAAELGAMSSELAELRARVAAVARAGDSGIHSNRETRG